MDGILRRSRENHLPSPFFSEKVIAASLFLTNAAFSVFAFTFPLQSRAISIITAGINLVGAYIVFYRIFPPAPKEIPPSRIETILHALDEVAIAQTRMQYEMVIPFIQSFIIPGSLVPIFNLLEGLSHKKLGPISAHQKTIGCTILLRSLLVNEEQQISKQQAASSLESFKKVYQEYVNSNVENGPLDQGNEKWINEVITNLIPELVAHKLEQYVLEIVNIWSRKDTTIHEAPLSWFHKWLCSMMKIYGKEKVQEELKLEAWASRIRESPQLNIFLANEGEQSEENIIIAKNRFEEWSKIAMAASALENQTLNQEALTNQETIREYLRKHEPLLYNFS